MPEETGYDLVDEPWIRVLDAEGVTREVSLLEVFEQAPTLLRLAGELPTQDAAMLRLLLAILHRALDPYKIVPRSFDEVPRAVVRLRGIWTEAVVSAARTYLEQHRDRFDLFHPFTPFFQVPGMRTAKGEIKPLSWLVGDMAVDSKTGAVRLPSMRSVRSVDSLPVAEAARWLVHLHSYDSSGIRTGVVGHPRAKAGKVSPEGVAWTGQLALVHLVGENLAETLLLNLWAVLLDEDSRAQDLPPWERAPQTLEPSPDLVSRPAGPVDSYTWQPRRVLLFGGRSGVTGVLVTYGDKFILQERQDLTKKEPMALWRYSEQQSKSYRRTIQMATELKPGQALWRGVRALLPGGEDASRRGEQPVAPTGVVGHAGSLAGEGVFDSGVARYRVVGVKYGTNASVVDEVIEDSLDLPAIVLRPDQAELRRLAIDAVESAEAGVGALAELARGLSRAAGAGREEAKAPGRRAYETGYAALDRPYREWLRRDLATVGDDPLLAEETWHRTARRILRDLGEGFVAGVPDKAWRGSGPTGGREDVGAVYRKFERMLRAALPRAYPPRGERAETSVQPGQEETS